MVLMAVPGEAEGQSGEGRAAALHPSVLCAQGPCPLGFPAKGHPESSLGNLLVPGSPQLVQERPISRQNSSGRWQPCQGRADSPGGPVRSEGPAVRPGTLHC